MKLDSRKVEKHFILRNSDLVPRVLKKRKMSSSFFFFSLSSLTAATSAGGTVIHWQANNSHSPKAIYVAQRPALLALMSEKGGWTLGGTAVTTELVTLFIKSKDWRLEDLTSCQHAETG